MEDLKKQYLHCLVGCDIGKRPIDLHLKGLKALGITVSEQEGKILCAGDKITGTKIELEFPSVGATENIMLVAVLAEGQTVILNAAKEPEIVDLEKYLNKMGAKISGSGTDVIKILGVKKLQDVSYHIMPDRIEAGTLLCAAAATEGEIKIKNVIPEQMTSITQKLEECGCKLDVCKNMITLKAPKRLKGVDIETLPYPGFPTDMQSVFVGMLSISKKTSLVTENIFENRYKYIDELNKMGAKIKVEERSAKIYGVKKLKGCEVLAKDLRGGAGLVIAALQARGQTRINNANHILRGYENLDKKLNSLGAQITIE